MKHSATTTALAAKLLFAFGIMSVLNDMLTLTMRTLLGGLRANHNALNITSSFDI